MAPWFCPQVNFSLGGFVALCLGKLEYMLYCANCFHFMSFELFELL